MKLHELKILEEYAEAKMKGVKLFEIRKNDRDFKVGDLVKYKVVQYDGTNLLGEIFDKESNNKDLCKYFNERLFRIKYITNYEQKDNYVVFSEEVLFIGE